MRQRATGDGGILLRGLCMDSLTHKLTCSGLQCRGSSSPGDRAIWGGTELTSFRTRAGVAGGRTALSFVEPSPNPASKENRNKLRFREEIDGCQMEDRRKKVEGISKCKSPIIKVVARMKGTAHGIVRNTAKTGVEWALDLLWRSLCRA